MISRSKKYRKSIEGFSADEALPLSDALQKLNQFEKVTIKHAHDRRVAKQLKIKRDLERRGGSSGHHHLVFGQTSPRARKRQTLF